MDEQRLVTRKGISTDFNEQRLKRRIALKRFLHDLLLGVMIALALACVEGVIWILNPLHLFGNTDSHTLPALLSNLTQTPLLWLFLFVQLIVVCALLFLLDKPLAIRRYIRDAQRELERYRTSHTSLVSWTALYETPLTCYQESPDLSSQGNVRELSILDQAQE